MHECVWKTSNIKPNNRQTTKLLKISVSLPDTYAKADVTPYMSFISNGALYIIK